jgi:hypothetical protein
MAAASERHARATGPRGYAWRPRYSRRAIRLGSKAEQHLTTAAAMYREMDMRFWLEKVRADLGIAT